MLAYSSSLQSSCHLHNCSSSEPSSTFLYFCCLTIYSFSFSWYFHHPYRSASSSFLHNVHTRSHAYFSISACQQHFIYSINIFLPFRCLAIHSYPFLLNSTNTYIYISVILQDHFVNHDTAHNKRLCIFIHTHKYLLKGHISQNYIRTQRFR